MPIIVGTREGEYVLAELTDRLSLDREVRRLARLLGERRRRVVRNPPRLLIPDLDVLPPADLSPENKYYLG